jgi:cytochrome c-type biogenesis protein
LIIAALMYVVNPGGDNTIRVETSDPAAVESIDTPEQFEASGAPAVIDDAYVRGLIFDMTEVGYTPDNVEIDAVFGHPLLLEVAGGAEGTSGSIVFFVTENIHDDQLIGEIPEVWLEIDGGDALSTDVSRVTKNDIHHRTTRFDFTLPAGSDADEFVLEDHSLTLVVGSTAEASTGANRLSWDLPVDLGAIVGATPVDMETDGVAGSTAGGSTVEVLPMRSLTDALRRETDSVAYGPVTEAEVTATYATPEYFAASFPTGAAELYSPNGEPVFVVSESTHTESLNDELPNVMLGIGSKTYPVDFTEVKVTSSHHRVTLMRFDVEDEILASAASMSMTLPDGQVMDWDLPIEYDVADTPFGIGWATVMALLAGMLASMWPCLFQLTAYFIPALAGMNMQDAQGQVALGQRVRVFRAALYFVLGFTIIYTAAGAIIGFAAGQLGETAFYGTAQRWVALGAGIIVIGLALRVAAKARAPLVCKMPVLSKMAHEGNGNARPWEMMVAGIAFATGCMTCFGSALVIGMVVYVGMAQSALYGAAILFLFSLGMGIPLVIAGVMMAKVLPVLFKLEKAVRWMGIASAALMLSFGILLISGNYMMFAEWIYSLTGTASPF